jgi:hypothetical protein
MERLLKLSNLNARPYLEANVLPDLRECIKDLLRYVQQSGELDRYWVAVEKLNRIAKRRARDVEVDRKRIDQGSAYNSDGDDCFDVEVDSASDYDSEDEYEP